MRKAYAPLLVPTVIFTKEQLWESIKSEIQHITPFGVLWKENAQLPSTYVTRFGETVKLDIDYSKRDQLDLMKSMWDAEYFDDRSLSDDEYVYSSEYECDSGSDNDFDLCSEDEYDSHDNEYYDF